MRKLIIVNGLPSSGKNTIGKLKSIEEDAVFLGYGYIDNEYNRNIMENYEGEENDLEGQNQIGAIKISEYKKLIDFALNHSTKMKNVVVVAPFYEWLLKTSSLLDIINKAYNVGVEVEFIWVDTELENTRKRMIEKGNINDSWKIKNWNRYSELITNITSIQDSDYSSRILKYPSIDMRYFKVIDNNTDMEITNDILEIVPFCIQSIDSLKNKVDI